MMIRRVLISAALSALFAPFVVGAVPVPLDSFDLAEMSCGRAGRARCGRSFLGNPLKLAGREYAAGVGTHVDSAIAFEADGRVLAFDAVVGIDDEVDDIKGYGQPNAGAVVFRVYADGRIVAESPKVRRHCAPVRFHAELKGARHIVLETVDGAEWASFWFGHADWADAAFTAEDGAVLRPVRLSRQRGLLTPPAAKAPRINGPAVYGVRPGRPILHRIPLVGEAPVAVTVTGLPEGVAFDGRRRTLSGAIAAPGRHELEIAAENRYGRTTRRFVIEVGERIALTPMLGWNSWNIFATKVTDADVRAAADAFERLGLVEHGWSYINIDDGWQIKSDDARSALARHPDGTIMTNPNFPDMKALGEHIHAKGLRFGIYSSPGPVTCGRYEGSYRYEETDARTWTEWGCDLVKYDLCSYAWQFIDPVEKRDRRSHPELDRMPYFQMGEILARQRRDIVYSLCQYGRADVESWAAECGGNSWRASSDVKDAWSKIVANVTRRGDAWRRARPGCWVDLDMAVFGRVKTFGSVHPSYLTPNEQYAHMGLWTLLASPILLGCDLTAVDDFTLNLLVNDGILDIHQDALGRMAAMKPLDGGLTQLWFRPLADGDVAVGVLNLAPFERRTAFSFADVGLPGPHWVREVWTGRCLGEHDGRLEVELFAHEMPVFRIRRNCPCKNCPQD